MTATFLPILDYGDVLYMYASSKALHALDTVYHGALRFVTSLKTLTHHCVLYERLGWTSLSLRRLKHWRIFIYKAMLGLLPRYLSDYLVSRSTSAYNLRSQTSLMLFVPRVRTELGKKAFSFAAPFSWNELQTKLGLNSLVSLNMYRRLLDSLEEQSSCCNCFI